MSIDIFFIVQSAIISSIVITINMNFLFYNPSSSYQANALSVSSPAASQPLLLEPPRAQHDNENRGEMAFPRHALNDGVVVVKKKELEKNERFSGSSSDSRTTSSVLSHAAPKEKEMGFAEGINRRNPWRTTKKPSAFAFSSRSRKASHLSQNKQNFQQHLAEVRKVAAQRNLSGAGREMKFEKSQQKVLSRNLKRRGGRGARLRSSDFSSHASSAASLVASPAASFVSNLNPYYRYGYPKYQTGGYPKYQTGGYPSYQTGGYPCYQTGGYPSYQTGGSPKYQTGGYPKYQTGGYPSYQTGGYPKYQTGGYPSYQTGGSPSYQTGGSPSYQTGGSPSYQTGGSPSYQTGGYPSYQKGGYPSYQTGGYPSYQTGGYPGYQTGGYSNENVETMGRKAHDLTNQYRASKGKQPLNWSQEIYDLCVEHSRNMAQGTVPFGHAGADQRFKRYPSNITPTGENVVVLSGGNNIAQQAVQSWIKSPGHEKNLAGPSNYGAVGAARDSKGGFYLTQMVGK